MSKKNDDGGYYGQDGEWLLGEFGLSQSDVKGVFKAMQDKPRKPLSSMQQTLDLMGVDNHRPSEFGLEVLAKYDSGELSYNEAIATLKARKD
jgi:hypothetical protein